MKRFLPIFLFLIGIAVFVGVFVFLKGKGKEGTPAEEETTIREIAIDERPVASLTPSSDGHWLKLKIEKIAVSADSLDYELLYKLPDGRTQGVPGTIKLERQKEIERDLLLGSESSGKFRYDEGVENGTLSLRFRDEKGKLIAKFSTEFRLLSGTSELETSDGAFSYSLAKSAKGEFFVTMETFGIYASAPSSIAAGPFGIFSSAEGSLSGTIEASGKSVYFWTGSQWQKLEGSKSSDIGIFYLASE